VLEVRLPGRQVASVKTAGYWFGEAAAFSMTHRIGTIVAAARSHLFHLPQAGFNHMIANADYCRHFAILTAKHLDEAAAIIEQLMVGDPQARVWPAIDELGEDIGEISLRVDAVDLCGLDQRCETCPVDRPLIVTGE